MALSQMSNYSNSGRTTHACEAHMLLPSPGKELQDVLSLPTPLSQQIQETTPAHNAGPSEDRDLGKQTASNLSVSLAFKITANCHLQREAGTESCRSV